ncbi:MAG: ACT domain-containing protein, partial [Subdoligranulum sp.]|nr:ACT domain-containing protein [Subdoligranulum sp.]
TLRPLPLLRFAVSATGGAHLCSIQYYLRFWLSSYRTSLAVSALRIMRYCLKQNERGIFMYGVSKISSEQNIMLTTFPAAQYSAQSLAEHLEVFAKAGIVVDMICQSAPRGTAVDFSFTTSYSNFAAVMQAIPAAAKANPPLISGGYTKINLFGEDMVTSCGVAARALAALAKVNAEVVLITTSDLDISLLIHQEDEDVALNALNKAFEL